VLYAATALSGLGLGVFGVWWETALAQRIPAHLLSRVSAWDWLGSLAFLPLGYLLAGPLATTLGGVRILVAGGIIGMGMLLLALLPRSTRHLTRLDPGPCGMADPGPGAEQAGREPDRVVRCGPGASLKITGSDVGDAARGNDRCRSRHA
jgi:hypothetical protein